MLLSLLERELDKEKERKVQEQRGFGEGMVVIRECQVKLGR